MTQLSMSLQRRRWVGTAGATLAAAVCVSGSAYAQNTTTATIFKAFTSHGSVTLHARSKAGYCWSGAITTPRRDAWRCLVGNRIYDPCFSSAHAVGLVLCVEAPSLKTGVKIRLTKPLPRARGNHSAPSLRLEPWAIELEDGRRCQFDSGGSAVVEGKRSNYFCVTGSEELWGFPDRGSEPWTILTAPERATKLTKLAGVRHAWM
jgi:hypothetical protein